MQKITCSSLCRIGLALNSLTSKFEMDCSRELWSALGRLQIHAQVWRLRDASCLLADYEEWKRNQPYLVSLEGA